VIRAQHESSVSELYRLLSRKRNHGSAFPSIDLEDVGKEDSFEEYQDWKRQLELGVGYVTSLITTRDISNFNRSSRIDNIKLPSLPPPSPPTGVTVFPDEIPDNTLQAPLKQEAAPSPVGSGPVNTRRQSSRKGTPAAPVPPAYSPIVPIAGPSRLPSLPPATHVAMSDIVPQSRSRRVFSPSLPPNISDWVPVDTYNPATEAPSTPPHILMPLESEYSASLPPIPPIPRRRKRKGSKGDDGPNDPYKLQAMYNINPISGSLATSSKCVMTSDWKVAMAEIRHMRTMERIEQKMENGRWSLRQPKKLKAPPVRKAHWDHLLEEMVSYFYSLAALQRALTSRNG
jgi:chromatin modification-related protein VID21